MTSDFASVRMISTERAWNCPSSIQYENDCLKIEGSCSAAGPQLNFSGTAEFKECLRETGLGLAAFSGSFNYSMVWDVPPSCVPSSENASCLSAMVDLSLSNPANLSVRFAESDTIAITALQAGLKERWRLAEAGLWRLVLTEFTAFSGGQVFQCVGEPLVCKVTEVVPADPPPAVDPACLDIPDCDSDAVCAAFVQSCPDTAELLGKFGNELRCQESQSRHVRTCLPVKIVTPPDDDGGPPPAQGICSRSGLWNDFCPVTFGTTVNGEGLDCQADVQCQTRDFSTLNGGPCGSPCFDCRFYNSNCDECDACAANFRCVSGCCAFDQDQDGYIDAGLANGGLFDASLQEKEDNCIDKANLDQSDVDLDCVGDVCDNCPTVPNGYYQASGQFDTDGDGVGDACDNCPLVHNGPNPTYDCSDAGCVEVPSVDNQIDSDKDGVGDACQGDYDGDGVPDKSDNCPRTMSRPKNPTSDQTDTDGDGVGDICDNCRRIPNPDQTDLVDGSGASFPDGRGDACQGDTDEDRVLDYGDPVYDHDNCVFDYNPDQADSDLDGSGDVCDICPNEYDPNGFPWACQEPDADEVPNAGDNCPFQYNPGQEPFGKTSGFPGQACSYCLISESPWGYDGDRDGVMDSYDCDNCPYASNADQRDTDGDLVGDLCDNCRFVSNFGQRDSDFDGIGDACAFCDFNGVCGEKENFFNCSPDCPAVCGNGQVESPTEKCDDGNLTDGDGCDRNCTVTACGNGVVTLGEICDDGNLNDGDGCDNNCTVTSCGNGIVTTGETCDDGNAVDDDYCYNDCTVPACGDGRLTAGEECGEPERIGCPGGGDCSSCICGCLSQDVCDEGYFCGLSQKCQTCDTGTIACTLNQQCADISSKCGAPPDHAFVCDLKRASCIPVPDSCGNGVCECQNGENFNVCAADCPQFETNCHDGVDNDCDGLVECAKGGEPDCAVYDPTACNIVRPPVCGDGICGRGEDCNTCPGDCPTCSPPIPK